MRYRLRVVAVRAGRGLRDRGQQFHRRLDRPVKRRERFAARSTIAWAARSGEVCPGRPAPVPRPRRSRRSPGSPADPPPASRQSNEVDRRLGRRLRLWLRLGGARCRPCGRRRRGAAGWRGRDRRRRRRRRGAARTSGRRCRCACRGADRQHSYGCDEQPASTHSSSVSACAEIQAGVERVRGEHFLRRSMGLVRDAVGDFVLRLGRGAARPRCSAWWPRGRRRSARRPGRSRPARSRARSAPACRCARPRCTRRRSGRAGSRCGW